jgi:hypothetical protein
MKTHRTAVAAEQADRRPAKRPRWGLRIDYDVDEAGNRHPVLRLAEGQAPRSPTDPDKDASATPTDDAGDPQNADLAAPGPDT